MAATVISSCPSRRSKSHEEVHKMTLGQTQDSETDKYVLELLSQLPPSKELLQHYKVDFTLHKLFLLLFLVLGEIGEV